MLFPTSFLTHDLSHFHHNNVMIGLRAIAYGTLRDRTSKKSAIALTKNRVSAIAFVFERDFIKKLGF